MDKYLREKLPNPSLKENMSNKEHNTAVELCATSIKFPIPGYPNYYADVNGGIWSKHSGAFKRLSPSVQKNGYLMFRLWVDKQSRYQYAHALVALTFLGERPIGMVICHAPDPDKTNCNVNNLRYDTRRANAQDWVLSGASKGRPGGIKLNADKVREARALKASGWTNTDIAKRFSVSLDTIRRVLNRECWSSVA